MRCIEKQLDIEIDGKKMKYPVTQFDIHHSINSQSWAEVIFSQFDSRDDDQESMIDNEDFSIGSEFTINVAGDELFSGQLVTKKIRINAESTAIWCLLYTKHFVLTRSLDNKVLEGGDLGFDDSLKIKMPESFIVNEDAIFTGIQNANWKTLLHIARLYGYWIVMDQQRFEMIDPKYSEPAMAINRKHTYLVDFDFSESGESVFSDIKARGWDVTEQKLIEVNSDNDFTNDSLTATTAVKLAEKLGIGERSLFYPGVTNKDVLQQYANSFHKSLEYSIRHGKLRFSSLVGPLSLGDTIYLVDFANTVDGSKLVSEINYSWRPNRDFITEVKFGINQSEVSEYHLAQQTTVSQFRQLSGIHYGVIQEFKHDSELSGRVPVLLTGTNEPIFARQMFPYTGSDNTGMFYMFKPGMEVAVAFINDDPSQPVIIGGFYNPVHQSPVPFDESTKNEWGVFLKDHANKPLGLAFSQDKGDFSLLAGTDVMMSISADEGIRLIANKSMIHLEDSDIELLAFEKVRMKAKSVEVIKAPNSDNTIDNNKEKISLEGK